MIELWIIHWVATPMNQWIYNEVKKIESNYL
jgi:hypothetical protein